MKCGRLRATFLGYGDLDGLAIEDKDTAVGRSVPDVDLIERSAPQRPNGQVESEWRARMQNQ
jgi:hypothetical protein